jgi:chromosomal replication initiation ATPase DnaA
LDFQFDSTIDGKAIKIASMVDEHTRESLLNLVERSITAERLVAELERVFAARRSLQRLEWFGQSCASTRFLADAYNVLVMGSVGVGKTFLANALGQTARGLHSSWAHP